MELLKTDPYQLSKDDLEARCRLLRDQIQRLGRESMDAWPWRRELRLVESALYVVTCQVPVIVRPGDVVRVRKKDIRPEGEWKFSQAATLRVGRQYVVHSVVFQFPESGTLMKRKWYVTLIETKGFPNHAGLEPIYQLAAFES